MKSDWITGSNLEIDTMNETKICKNGDARIVPNQNNKIDCDIA